MNKRKNNIIVVLAFLVSISGMILSSNAYGQYKHNDYRDDNRNDYRDEEIEGPGVILYRHADFRGSRIFVKAGRNIRDLKRMGWNDQVSSIELVGNTYIRVYEHRNYQGASVTIKRDVIDLVELTRGIGGNWNDRITSIKVYTSRERGDYWRDKEYDKGYGSEDYPYCIFYKHSNGRGGSFKGDLGRHRKITSHWNDEVSSVWVRRGYRVVLYEHDNFSGRRVVLEGKGWKDGSVYNLDRFGFNDAMSSYKLERVRSRDRRRR